MEPSTLHMYLLATYIYLHLLIKQVLYSHHHEKMRGCRTASAWWGWWQHSRPLLENSWSRSCSRTNNPRPYEASKTHGRYRTFLNLQNWIKLAPFALVLQCYPIIIMDGDELCSGTILFMHAPLFLTSGYKQHSVSLASS